MDAPLRQARNSALRAGLILLTLLLLLSHAIHYRFLTDDAFISFRYARNLAEGHGLVFNPGREAVEGYTNFLWVLLLAGAIKLGASPETTSQLLGLLLTVGLWGLVLAWALRDPPEPPRRWLLLYPLICLALTRSVAVWSTGGLETRLFEVLVLAGALGLLALAEAPGPVSTPRAVLPGILLALAALTRPDGVMVGACLLAAGLFVTRGRGRSASTRLMAPAASFLLLVASHVAWRRLYYGDWLPNTYYAKVGGRTWWEMGSKYLLMFALEYAAFLWIPLLAAAVAHHRERGTWRRLAFPVAVIVPHATFVASVGGDHFEYRPLDLYFPFLVLLFHDGARWMAGSRLPAWAVAGLLALVPAGLVALPSISHAQYPEGHHAGFPGMAGPEDREASRFMAPDRLGAYSLPGLGWLGRSYSALLRETTGAFVGLRAEEHAAFLGTVIPEGKALARLVEKGTLPADTHLAIDCVGAIPFYSRLVVLDRLGLTDREVARRGETSAYRLMAHDRRADFDYAASRGVDFWALHFVHLTWTPGDPLLVELIRRPSRERTLVHAADLGDGTWLVAYLPQGPDAARRRFPRLRFGSLGDPNVASQLQGVASQTPR